VTSAVNGTVSPFDPVGGICKISDKNVRRRAQRPQQTPPCRWLPSLPTTTHSVLTLHPRRLSLQSRTPQVLKNACSVVGRGCGLAPASYQSHQLPSITSTGPLPPALPVRRTLVYPPNTILECLATALIDRWQPDEPAEVIIALISHGPLITLPSECRRTPSLAPTTVPNESGVPTGITVDEEGSEHRVGMAPSLWYLSGTLQSVLARGRLSPTSWNTRYQESTPSRCLALQTTSAESPPSTTSKRVWTQEAALAIPITSASTPPAAFTPMLVPHEVATTSFMQGNLSRQDM
jgi:hypothetical protein